MNDECKMKTHDVLLLVLFGMFFIFGILSFFMVPKDAPTALKVVEGIAIFIGDVLAFKFGIHQAQVQAGTTQLTKTVAPPIPAPSAPEGEKQ